MLLKDQYIYIAEVCVKSQIAFIVKFLDIVQREDMLFGEKVY